MKKKVECACGYNCEGFATIADLTIAGRRVHAVLERERCSGSHKDHPGRFLASQQRESGIIRRNQLARFIVPSSGNFGHSFAMHTRDDNVEIVIVTDKLSPPKMVQRFRDDYCSKRVHVEVVDDPDETGSHMKARMRRIKELQLDDPKMLLINQYADQRIPKAYELLLVSQLYCQLRGQIDAVFVPVGTGGLANGLVRFREHFGLLFPIFAVDADGSCLVRPPRHGVKRRLPGYGNGIQPALMTEVCESLNRWINVDDLEAVDMCYRLRDQHGLWVGPSSGAVLAGLEKMAMWRSQYLPSKGNILAILPDGGETYEDTVYSAAWLEKQGLSRNNGMDRKRLMVA